jgi:distribution and morphology protein 34
MSGTGSSSAARTSGSSWDTDKNPPRSISTIPSSQQPSRPLSIDSKAVLPRNRAPSLSGTSPGRSFPPRHVGPGGITLPLNNSVSQLATLSHSAHTLSPYARGHEHIAVRSFPHLGKTGPSAGSSSSTNLSAIAENQPGAVKARRKRIFHLNQKTPEAPLSPDIDDTVDGRYMLDSRSPSPQRSRSPSLDYVAKQRPLSLTGVASKVMGDLQARPNYGRAPASRTSYGFPPSRL